MGRFWIRVGYWMIGKLALDPLKDYKETGQSSRKLRYFFGHDIEDLFLLAEVDDMDLSYIIDFVKKSFGVVIPFLVIMLTIVHGLLFLGIEYVGAVVLSMFLSFFAVGFYFPVAMVFEDAKIMTKTRTGLVDFSSRNAKRLIEGLFGITGLISGFSVFSEQDLLLNENTGETLQDVGTIGKIVIFVFLLSIITVLTFPFLFNALIVYFAGHRELVNNFRLAALNLNIPPARLRPEFLSSEEIQQIAMVMEKRKSPEGVGRFLGRIGLVKAESEEYTDEEIMNVRQYGGWICKDCYHINPHRNMENCERCKKPYNELLPKESS